MEKIIGKFAFIGHPISLSHFYNLAGFWGFILKKFPPYWVKRWMLGLPPYLYNIMEFESILGTRAQGIGITLPLLPEQFISLGEEKVIQRILKAVKLSEKLGAKLVALGGFTSVVGNEGELISKQVNIPVTSGNVFPAYLSIEGIEKACNKMHIKMSDSVAAVIGATGDIGSICAKILSRKVLRLYLVARNETRIQQFAEKIRSAATAEVEVSFDIDEVIANSDIVLTATTSIASIINPLKLKTGSIVCDVAVPANIVKDVVRLRNDVLVFEGGLTKVPNIQKMKDRKFHKAMLSNNCIFGCLAEAVLLTLENRFESFSLGRGNITEEKVNEIGAIARKHGFEVSDFFCGYKLFSDEEIDCIRKNAHR